MAARLAAELAEALGIKAELVRGGRGIFDVNVDGALVFSKHALHRFPDPGEISALLGNDAG